MCATLYLFLFRKKKESDLTQAVCFTLGGGLPDGSMWVLTRAPARSTRTTARGSRYRHTLQHILSLNPVIEVDRLAWRLGGLLVSANEHLAAMKSAGPGSESTNAPISTSATDLHAGIPPIIDHSNRSVLVMRWHAREQSTRGLQEFNWAA